VFLVVAIPFVIQHLRGAIYPALEQEPSVQELGSFDLVREGAAKYEAEPSAAADREVRGGVVGGVAGGVSIGRGLAVSGERKKERELKRGDAPPSAPAQPKESSLQAQEFDPKAMIQTGPGIPSWQWRKVWLGWNGPVERSQQLHLF